MHDAPDSDAADVVPEPNFTHRQIVVVLVGLLCGLSLAGLDSTIVAPSLPTIVGELGGLEHISWVVSAYLLTETIATLVYGKFGDALGRTRMFRIAIVIFVGGSALCGLAQSLPMLVLFRGLQGIGAGGLISMSFAIMGDVIAPRERGRYTGYLSGVFAVTSVIGPLIGGYLTDHTSWRWIFYVNIPVGVAALVVTGRAFRQVPRHHGGPFRLDRAGFALLTVGLTGLVLALEWGGREYGWLSPTILGLLAVGAVALVACVWWSRRAADPIVPVRLYRSDVVRVAGGMQFLAGLTMFGTITYLPLFLQVVKNVGVGESGLLLVPVMLGVLGAAIPAGRMISRYGRYAFTGPLGFGILIVGGVLLASMGRGTPLFVTFAAMAVNGIGIGVLSPPLTIAVQNAVPRASIGQATASNLFLRNLGSTVGVAIFGAVFAGRVTGELADRLPEGAAAAVGGDPTGLLREPARLRELPVEVADAVRDSVQASLHLVFVAAAVFAVVGFLLATRLRDLPLRSANEPDAPAGPAPALEQA